MTVPVPAGHHPVSAIVTSPGRAIIAAQVSLASGRANMGNVSGTLPVANGGTGATNADDARTNLGIEDVVAMTTDQVDDVMDDDESIVSDNVVNGTVFSYIWEKIRAWGDATFAPASHTHSQSQISDTPITVANGGTGATTESAARTSLGITPANIGAAPTSHDHSGQALTPASVAATGAVSGSSVSDSVGSLAELRESVSHKLPYVPEIILDTSYGVTGITSQWCDDVHTAIGTGCCAAYIRSGFVSLVIQQGNDPDYYSLLVVNYGWVTWCSHHPSGWIIRQLSVR